MSLFKVYVDGSLFYHPNLSKLAITEAQIQEDAENMNSILSEFNTESSSISETMVQMNTGIRDISTTIEESARAVSDIAAEANSLATSIKAIQVDSEKNQGISDELLAEVQRFDKL